MFQKKIDFFEVRSEVRLDDHLMEFGIFAFVQIDLSLANVSSEGQRKDFLAVDMKENCSLLLEMFFLFNHLLCFLDLLEVVGKNEKNIPFQW